MKTEAIWNCEILDTNSILILDTNLFSSQPGLQNERFVPAKHADSGQHSTSRRQPGFADHSSR